MPESEKKNEKKFSLNALSCLPVATKECINSREKIDDFLYNIFEQSVSSSLLVLCVIFFYLHNFIVPFNLLCCELWKKLEFRKGNFCMEQKITISKINSFIWWDLFRCAIFSPFGRNSSFLMMTWWLLWSNIVVDDDKHLPEIVFIQVKKTQLTRTNGASTSEYWMKQNAVLKSLCRCSFTCACCGNVTCWRNCQRCHCHIIINLKILINTNLAHVMNAKILMNIKKCNSLLHSVEAPGWCLRFVRGRCFDFHWI